MCGPDNFGSVRRRPVAFTVVRSRQAFAAQLAELRPFTSAEELKAAAARVWGHYVPVPAMLEVRCDASIAGGGRSITRGGQLYADWGRGGGFFDGSWAAAFAATVHG